MVEFVGNLFFGVLGRVVYREVLFFKVFCRVVEEYYWLLGFVGVGFVYCRSWTLDRLCVVRVWRSEYCGIRERKIFFFGSVFLAFIINKGLFCVSW